MRSRICPHCDKPIPLDRGYGYDEELNLVCKACEKKIVPTKEAKVGHWKQGAVYVYGTPADENTDNEKTPISLSYAVYDLLQRYWESQTDPLYAILSRRGNSVNFVTVFASQEEIERLREVAKKIIKTSDNQTAKLRKQIWELTTKKPVKV